jgi:hypothetical protein
MFPDSEIAKQYSCARTKSTYITYAIAADSIETIKGDVVAGRLMYSLATDGSSVIDGKWQVMFSNKTLEYCFCMNNGLCYTSFATTRGEH